MKLDRVQKALIELASTVEEADKVINENFELSTWEEKIKFLEENFDIKCLNSERDEMTYWATLNALIFH